MLEVLERWLYDCVHSIAIFIMNPLGNGIDEQQGS